MGAGSYGSPEGYEAFMGRWSAGLAPSFLQFACSEAPESIIDIGCGTGSLLRAAAERFPVCRLVGVDPVVAYAEDARARVGRESTSFVVAVVEQLPFPSGAFACCLSLLLLQELENRAQALGEMARVTRRGGVVAACQWNFGDGMPMLAAVRRALATIAPELGTRARSGAARAFASEAELREHWEAAGLEQVETGRLTAALTYRNFAELWQPLLTGPTPMTALVASLPKRVRDAVGRHLRQDLFGGRDATCFLEAEAFAVRGRARGGRLPGRRLRADRPTAS